MPWTCPTCKHVFDVGPSVPITPPEAHAEVGELRGTGVQPLAYAAAPAEGLLREAVVKAAIQWYCVREDEEYEQACEDLEKAVKKLPEFDPSAPAGTDKLLSMARSWQEAYHDVALQMVGELRALAAGTEGPGMAAIDESIRLARENRDRFGGERWDGIVWGMGEARRVAALAREGAKK